MKRWTPHLHYLCVFLSAFPWEGAVMLSICRVLVVTGLLLELLIASSRGQTLKRQPGRGQANAAIGPALIVQSRR